MPGRNPYAFISLTGLGLAPVRRLKERGPQQHGSTDVGFLLDERMLNLALLITGRTLAEMDVYRDALAEILKPLENTPIKLRLTRDNGSVRQLDCHVTGMVDFPNTLEQRIGASQQVVVQLEASDPIPYDPALRNIVFDSMSTGGGFQVPMQVLLAYSGGTSINVIQTLNYAGKWATSPIIYVAGPATDLVITNVTTGKKLDFTGRTIGPGDTYEIDLRYGYKSVRDSNGDLQNAALTDDSDLVTWSFVPGINDIHVVIPSGMDATSQIRVEFRDKYPSF